MRGCPGDARPAQEPGKAPGSPGTCVRSPGGCSSGFPPLKVAARGRRRCQLPVEHSQVEVGKLNGLQAPSPCVLSCWEKGKDSGFSRGCAPLPTSSIPHLQPLPSLGAPRLAVQAGRVEASGLSGLASRHGRLGSGLTWGWGCALEGLVRRLSPGQHFLRLERRKNALFCPVRSQLLRPRLS